VKISEKKVRELVRGAISERALRKNISSSISEVLSSKAQAVSRGSSGGGWRRKGNESGEEDIGVDASKVGKTKGSNKITSLSSEAQPIFREFARLANEAGITIRFTSTHRFPSHQWNLKFGPNKVTGNPVAQPCRSDHQYGYAADINATYKDTNGKSIRAKMASNEASWLPVVEIARKAGLNWLGMKDPVHFYLRNVSGGIKDKCDDFYSEKLGTSDKTKWGSASMAALENDPEIKNILKVTESNMSMISESVVRDTILRIIGEERLSDVLNINITVTEEEELSNLIQEIISEDINEVLRSDAIAKGARSGSSSLSGRSGDISDEDDVTCDPENIRDIPGVVVNPGKNAYIGVGGVKGFAVGEMEGMMKRLQSHLDSELGSGYKVSSNGVMRTIRKIFDKASKSKLASWNTKHGVGTAIDLKITTPTISTYAGPSATNPDLANDTKLMKAFKSFADENSKFRWGGTFTSKNHPHQDVPGVGSVDVGELHHWEIKDISPYISRLIPALKKHNLPVPTASGDQYKLEPLYRAIAGCDSGTTTAEGIVLQSKRNKNTKK